MSGPDVGGAGFVGTDVFGAAEVCEHESVGLGVDEEVGWLDVAVANAVDVQVAEAAEELIGVPRSAAGTPTPDSSVLLPLSVPLYRTHLSDPRYWGEIWS